MNARDDLTVRAATAAPPAAVFRALTRPEDLRIWLADQVDVDLDAGRYTFGGPRTPGGAGTQRLVDVTPDRRIRLAWPMADDETTVDITVAPRHPRGALVVIDHRRAPRPGPDRAGMLDFWCLSAGNLANHVEGRDTVVAHDFADRPESGSARAEIAVHADIGRVFRALTDPAELDEWIAITAAVQPWPGGTYDLGWGPDRGPEVVTAYEAPHRLAYRWRERDLPATEVVWTLERVGTGTRVRLRHGVFPPGHSSDQTEIGWKNLLIDLQRRLDAGPFWERTAFRADSAASAAGGSGATGPLG